jgi:hypothetical protein
MLNNYLKEEKEVELLILHALDRDCKPFLRELKGTNGFVYRGNTQTIESIKKFSPNVDKGRVPVAASKELHELVNVASDHMFGWKFRDGVPTSTSYGWADSFGQAYMFFPIGAYKYVYSPNVTDFNFEFANAVDAETWMWRGWQRNLKGSEAIDWMISKLKDFRYTDTDLRKMLSGNAEVSFNCREYYLVHPNYGVKIEKYLL